MSSCASVFKKRDLRRRSHCPLPDAISFLLSRKISILLVNGPSNIHITHAFSWIGESSMFCRIKSFQSLSIIIQYGRVHNMLHGASYSSSRGELLYIMLKLAFSCKIILSPKPVVLPSQQQHSITFLTKGPQSVGTLYV